MSGSSDTDHQLEHIFDTIREVSIQYLHEKEEQFRGLTESGIESLEKTHGISFPKAYHYFLQRFAAGQLSIFDCQSYSQQGIADALEVSEELLQQDKATLPAHSFPFSQWQGYQFYYFVHSGSDDPETFLYMEGGGNPSKPPQIYAMGPFTQWLIDLAISNTELIGRVRGYDTEKGIEILKSLLKQES